MVVLGILCHLLLGASSAHAAFLSESAADWHEGAYCLLGLGLINVDRDVNLVTSEAFGRQYQTAFVMTMGWNITNAIAAEGLLRYSTPEATFDGARYGERIMTIALSARYAFLTKRQTGKTIKLLPYIKGGALVHMLGVQGGDRVESKVAASGMGFGAGGGLELISGKPGLMLLLDVAGDLVLFEGQRRKGILVTTSGPDPQINTTLSVGVHF